MPLAGARLYAAGLDSPVLTPTEIASIEPQSAVCKPPKSVLNVGFQDVHKC